jgi:hypothetical protein
VLLSRPTTARKVEFEALAAIAREQAAGPTRRRVRATAGSARTRSRT